jgi:hypothetical protein
VTPRVRQEALLLQELPDETLIYDQRTHAAHCLNGSAAEVFRLADGSRSVDELAEAMGERLGCADPELVWAALAELDRAGLLEESPKPPRGPGTRSRRAALERLGLGLLVPTVVSVLAPTPAAALATCVTNCTGQADLTPCDNGGGCTGINVCIGEMCE